MKKLLSILTLLSLATFASAQQFEVVLPGGDFGPPVDPAITNQMNGPYVGGLGGTAATYDLFSATEGNPDGCAVIEAVSATGWGVHVIGNLTNTSEACGVPVSDDFSYAALGLVPGQEYTFRMDIRFDTNGTFTGLGDLAGAIGFKVEFWKQTDCFTQIESPTASVIATDTNWITVELDYVIPAGRTHFKFVPLVVDAGEPTRVLFDNCAVASAPIPLFAEIDGPPGDSTVFTNYFTTANAGVFPGSVTNVIFYEIRSGATNLLGSDSDFPWSLPVVGAATGVIDLFCVVEGADINDNYITATSSVVTNITVSDVVPENIFTVDPTDGWISYAVGYEPSGLPRGSQTESFNDFYGSDDLQAEFSDSGGPTVLTLGPLVNGDTNCNPFPEICWYLSVPPPPNEAEAIGFNDFDAFYYVEPSGLNGNVITFKGTNTSLTLGQSNNLAGVGWTCEAYIRDISTNAAVFNETAVTITNGAAFSLSLATIPDVARTVQYGFRTTGPNVMPGARDWYGTAVFESAPLPPPTNVVVDANVAAGWLGDISIFTNNLPGVGGFISREPFGLDAITAEFGCDLTLKPTVIDDDTNFWYILPAGPGATGNKIVEGNTFVADDSLSGKRVIFSGNVQSTALLSAMDPSNNTWTAKVFIKDFDPGFNTVVEVSEPITGPGPFSITNATIPSPGRHVQYGFAITGPNVWSTEVDAYGSVVIDNVALVAPTVIGSLNGPNIDLSFETCTGNTYTVQYKDSLNAGSWTNLPGSVSLPGTGSTLIVSDPASNPGRYYRVLVQ